VRDGETGYLFEPNDTQELKRALRRAYDNREELPGLGARARELMVADHTWLSRVRYLIPEIERVLQARR
jgi:glycosyltransferase involved in cell wall biosynthesis